MFIETNHENKHIYFSNKEKCNRFDLLPKPETGSHNIAYKYRFLAQELHIKFNQAPGQTNLYAKSGFAHRISLKMQPSTLISYNWNYLLKLCQKKIVIIMWTCLICLTLVDKVLGPLKILRLKKMWPVKQANFHLGCCPLPTPFIGHLKVLFTVKIIKMHKWGMKRNFRLI